MKGDETTVLEILAALLQRPAVLSIS